MKKIFILLLVTACAHAEKALSDYPTFFEWNRACQALPVYDINRANPNVTPITPGLLTQELNKFFGLMSVDLSKCTWHGSKPGKYFYDLKYDLFEPYAQKLIVAPGNTVAVHGDFHGDVHSLNRFIYQCATEGFLDPQNPFKIKDSNFYMLFLGDYVDRGWYGAETIYTILRLKNANPDRVFMVRGNHEDYQLNVKYGFVYELQQKFNDGTLARLIYRMYNFLPLTLYLGIGMPHDYDVIQCCHGGMELGFDPGPLLSDVRSSCMKIGPLMQAQGYAHLHAAGIKGFERFFKDNKPVSETNGFMWNDFIVNPDKALARSERDGFRGTMFEFGRLATQVLLNAWSTPQYTMRAVFRAHQHSHKPNAMMNRIYNRDKQGHPNDAGAGKMWIMDDRHKKTPELLNDIAVVTFNVAPNTGYGAPYQSYGMLRTAKNYDDCRLRIVKLLPLKFPLLNQENFLSAIAQGNECAAG